MMRFMSLIAVLALGPTAAFGQDDEGWSGRGELGFVSARGNTETETLNIGAVAILNRDDWRHTFSATALRAEDSGETTAERFELGAQSDWKINEKSYWFGSLRYESDEFSQFDDQATLALGYGYQWWKNDVHELATEIGLGVRRATLRLSGEDETDPVVRGSLAYLRNISETAKFTNDLLIEAGSDNTFGSNVTALTAKVYEDIGIKLAYEIRHNTDVDEPLENSDRLTTVSLVYEF